MFVVAAKKRKPEIRVFVEEDLDRLLKAIAGIKDSRSQRNRAAG